MNNDWKNTDRTVPERLATIAGKLMYRLDSKFSRHAYNEGRASLAADHFKEAALDISVFEEVIFYFSGSHILFEYDKSGTLPKDMEPELLEFIQRTIHLPKEALAQLHASVESEYSFVDKFRDCFAVMEQIRNQAMADDLEFIPGEEESYIALMKRTMSRPSVDMETLALLEEYVAGVEEQMVAEDFLSRNLPPLKLKPGDGPLPPSAS